MDLDKHSYCTDELSTYIGNYFRCKPLIKLTATSACTQLHAARGEFNILPCLVYSMRRRVSLPNLWTTRCANISVRGIITRFIFAQLGVQNSVLQLAATFQHISYNHREADPSSSTLLKTREAFTRDQLIQPRFRIVSTIVSCFFFVFVFFHVNICHIFTRHQR